MEIGEWDEENGAEEKKNGDWSVRRISQQVPNHPGKINQFFEEKKTGGLLFIWYVGQLKIQIIVQSGSLTHNSGGELDQIYCINLFGRRSQLVLVPMGTWEGGCQVRRDLYFSQIIQFLQQVHAVKHLLEYIQSHCLLYFISEKH